MVTHDKNRCIQCALCIKTCHEYCITTTDDGIKIDHNLCSTCTQCIAICPNQALSWNDILAVKINKDLLPNQAQLREFLQARRSERHFTRKKISRALLKEIAIMGKYSPTNNYDMDVIIVDNEEIIQKLGEICMKKSKRLYNLVYKPKIMRWIGKRISPEYIKAEVKFIESFKRKSFFGDATALIIIIGDPRIRLTELSSQYFLYNMQLYGKTLGIGSRQSNAGKMFLAKNKQARMLLEIPKGKQIQAMMFCGYPALEFKNKVEGISPKIYFR